MGILRTRDCLRVLCLLRLADLRRLGHGRVQLRHGLSQRRDLLRQLCDRGLELVDLRAQRLHCRRLLIAGLLVRGELGVTPALVLRLLVCLLHQTRDEILDHLLHLPEGIVGDPHSERGKHPAVELRCLRLQIAHHAQLRRALVSRAELRQGGSHCLQQGRQVFCGVPATAALEMISIAFSIASMSSALSCCRDAKSAAFRAHRAVRSSRYFWSASRVAVVSSRSLSACALSSSFLALVAVLSFTSFVDCSICALRSWTNIVKACKVFACSCGRTSPCCTAGTPGRCCTPCRRSAAAPRRCDCVTGSAFAVLAASRESGSLGLCAINGALDLVALLLP